MLLKVSLDELVQDQVLPYDLYSSEGLIAFPSGSKIEDIKERSGSYKGLYRHQDSIPLNTIDHEGRVYEIDSLSQAEKQERAEEDNAEIVYTGEQAKELNISMDYVWERLKRGAPLDVALTELICDSLISEVTTNVDQIQYLSQIRVRDKFTHNHILDVTAVSIALAHKLGYDKQEIMEIALSGILHDLGKLLIPKNIMFKPSRLSEKEFEVMKLHPGIGYRIIKDELKLPEQIARPALEHQEMWSGGGYPLNIAGDEIHPYSQIVKIADVYDALTSKRPYKEAIPSSRAIKIMLSEGEKSFNPELLDIFINLANYHEAAQQTA